MTMNTAQQVAVIGINALLGALPGTDKGGVLKALFIEHKGSLPDGSLDALLDTVPRQLTTTTLASAKNSYPDNRAGVTPHKAIDFTATFEKQQRAEKVLENLLGKDDAKILIADWSGRVSFSSTVIAPATNQVTLFLSSNGKARNRDYAGASDKTTQEEDFKAAGLTFADDMQATLICAALVNRARTVKLDMRENASSWKANQAASVSQLTDNEFDVLCKLREGVVRSRSGALVVIDDGRLRAGNFDDDSFSYCWAFGGVSPAESKN